MKIISSLAALILATALNSHASVITQTVDFGTINSSQQFYFNQFNTSLGNLTNVTLDWTVNSSINSFTLTNKNTGTVTLKSLSFTASVQGFVPSVGDAGDQVLSGFSNGSKTNINQTLAKDASYTTTNVLLSPTIYQTDSYVSGDANFNSFKGTGQVPLYLSSAFGATVTATGAGSNPTWLTSMTGSTTGNLVVTYTYDAAPPPVAPVPEPPAVILGFGGILGMAGIAFLRRSKQPAEEQAAA